MKKQIGLTSVGNLFFVFWLIFSVFIVVKLFPSYFEYLNARSVLLDYAANPEASSDSQSVFSALIRRLDINGIRLSPENILIHQDPDGLHIEIKYETRIAFVGNVDLLLSFDKTVTVHPH